VTIKVFEVVIDEKSVSYGHVKLVDAGNASPRYRIYLNNSLREVSDDLATLRRIFDKNYY
jgi:hypothetical protein